jgi:putative phage-type endonuclease
MNKREEELKHLEFVKNIPQHPQMNPNGPGKNPAWLEQRKHRLTSSDAATVLGINPYKKPEELLLEKCGAGRQFFGNEATAHGEKYEDEAISKYELLMGKTNHDFGMISFGDLDPIRKNSKYIHEKYHFLGGSPDGIAIDNSDLEKLNQVEVKCPMRRKIKHGQVPEHYFPQVQLNMFILDLEITDFVEYLPGTIPGTNQEINIVRVHRDEEWFDKNFPMLESFWTEVLYWRQRDITTHPAYSKYYKIPKKHEKLFIETDEIRPT